jgi:hypothetical protein
MDSLAFVRQSANFKLQLSEQSAPLTLCGLDHYVEVRRVSWRSLRKYLPSPAVVTDSHHVFAGGNAPKHYVGRKCRPHQCLARSSRLECNEHLDSGPYCVIGLCSNEIVGLSNLRGDPLSHLSRPGPAR